MNELFAPPESGLLISYLRVSLEDENTGESESISNQRDLIVCYLKQHPELKIVERYIDNGYTGTNFDRPNWERMMADVKSGRINCIIVKDYCAIIGLNQKDLENQGILA